MVNKFATVSDAILAHVEMGLNTRIQLGKEVGKEVGEEVGRWGKG